jgi:two-component system osmolarity sensor histidine kinase EnvZ
LSRLLKELAEKARLIGQDIDSIAIKPSGPKEVQDVAIAMNKMRADLEAMNKKQKFLLASISHDLRTPLTRIHIATQLLAPDTKGFIQGINEDIDEMNEVLHRFIELARFNIEETEPWQVGDITMLIKEAAAKYQHSGTLILLALSDTPPVRYKLKALQSYLYNLINNSIKHGAGNITISSQTRGNCVELCVSDQGSGFSMSPKELIAYSDFNIGHSAVNGLGLRIVQLIANMHEADLTLGNKLEGGAEVKLTLKAYIDLG